MVNCSIWNNSTRNVGKKLLAVPPTIKIFLPALLTRLIPNTTRKGELAVHHFNHTSSLSCNKIVYMKVYCIYCDLFLALSLKHVLLVMEHSIHVLKVCVLIRSLSSYMGVDCLFSLNTVVPFIYLRTTALRKSYKSK